MSDFVVLRVENLTKDFPGVRALDDVTIDFKLGQVHALMGENGAGKSTLMKCLFGLYRPDQGRIILDGEAIQFRNARHAMDYGISMVQQELHPIPRRSVMENIWLGRYASKFGFINEKELYDQTQKLFDELEIQISPKAIMGTLSPSQMQMVSIATAVSMKAKVVILDEPTSSLADDEIAQLFGMIQRLKDMGVVIIYISHKMDEILRISDEVSIMRDGAYMGTYPAAELTRSRIIQLMVGRDIQELYPALEPAGEEVLLEVKDFSSTDPQSFQEVSFKLHRGEILGLGGLVGARRTELVEALFGLRPVSRGEIYIKNNQVQIKSPIDAKKNGLALLTEERRATGIFPVLSVHNNMIISKFCSHPNPFAYISDRRMSKDVGHYIDSLRIKTPTAATLIRNLSGGNQQKVLLGRWLMLKPDILILDEPTRGIDVGAKHEIYVLMKEFVAQGKSIIMISSEMPELIGMSHRVMVMCSGKVTGFVDAAEATQEKIMSLAVQFTS